VSFCVSVSEPLPTGAIWVLSKSSSLKNKLKKEQEQDLVKHDLNRLNGL
jgi:hypothetical protein